MEVFSELSAGSSNAVIPFEEVTNTNSIDINVNYNFQKIDILWPLVAKQMERKEKNCHNLQQ